ncbi:leucine-rich repeat-containing protein 61 isoform X1 [Chiloscyllium plagiosum]|uniref:leucine-rich repeat-containing protein 61 isoform X1 n=2 Tax=Chiloscyllium plagiosum TaxID=36176 RepID=UPI001CB82E21|nr:leucine-rich repeat-containing protein 61 isoform X1 [Chiloscyllium plagiosum]
MEVKDREGSDENMKVTVQMLKSRTGQFDLESILFLKLRNIGITNLGCIGDCVNVERLDLSGNDISNLAPLTSLKVLIVLNLSANRISNLDPLCSCENLQNLNLSGNLISSVDSLRSLSELKNLEVIRLKDTVCNFSNPVCMNTAYHSAMLEIFPKIKSLDGERLSGRGSDLYQLCKKMEDSLKEMCSIGPIGKISAPKKWVEDNYWELKPIQKTQSDEAVEKFYNILKECRELNNKAADVIEKSERTLSSGK